MNEPDSKLSIPPWAWAFAAACIAIPIVAIGGLIPGALGGGGAAACVAISRADKPAWVRASLCTGLTAACWGLFAMLVVFVAGFTNDSSANAASKSAAQQHETRRTDLDDEDTRRKIYARATRMLPKIAEAEDQLVERRREGRSTDFHKSRIAHLETMRDKQQEFALGFFDITEDELEEIIDEGHEAGWPHE